MHLRFGVNKGCYANHKRRKIAAFLNISFNFMMVQLSFVGHFSFGFGQPFCPTFTRLMDRIRRIYIKRGTLQVKYQGLNMKRLWNTCLFSSTIHVSNFSTRIDNDNFPSTATAPPVDLC